jgi:hypothetical protein
MTRQSTPSIIQSNGQENYCTSLQKITRGHSTVCRHVRLVHSCSSCVKSSARGLARSMSSVLLALKLRRTSYRLTTPQTSLAPAYHCTYARSGMKVNQTYHSQQVDMTISGYNYMKQRQISGSDHGFYISIYMQWWTLTVNDLQAAFASDYYAMVRTLGTPALFITFSTADLWWEFLLRHMSSYQAWKSDEYIRVGKPNSVCTKCERSTTREPHCHQIVLDCRPGQESGEINIQLAKEGRQIWEIPIQFDNLNTRLVKPSN